MRLSPAESLVGRGRTDLVSDCIRFELLGGHFEIVSTRPSQGDRVASVAEPFSNNTP